MGNNNYYATRPIERLERDVEGLNGIVELLQAVCSGKNNMNDISPSSFSSLLEIVKDDIEGSISDYYRLKNASASQETSEQNTEANTVPITGENFPKAVNQYVDAYFETNPVCEDFFEEFGEQVHNG